MAINSLNSARNASSYGLSGLVSGMNTQDMVEKMLSGTQAKIDRAGQKKATLQNKQQMYRDVAAQLRSLQSNFMSFTGKYNLYSSAFYNTMNATVSPPKGVSAAFSVSASSAAKVGSVKVDRIEQLAKAFSMKTDFDASGKVTANLSKASASQLYASYRGGDAKLTIQVGSQSVVIENAPEFFAGKSNTQVAEDIQKLFNEAPTPIDATVRFVNNKLTIAAADPKANIVVRGNESGTNKTLAMKMFGEYSSLSGAGEFAFAIDTEKYLPEFKVNLDGREQAIKLNLADLKAFADTGDATALADSVEASLLKMFGKDSQGFNMIGVERLYDAGDPTKVVGFNLQSKSQSRQFTVTGNAQVMGTLGMKSGMSNKLNDQLSLRDLNFNVKLEGSQHAFSINGVDFSFSATTSLSKVISEINNSKAGVKISYLASEDRFVIANAEQGAGRDGISMSQSEGNLLSSLFGVAGSNTAVGQGVSKTMVGGSVAAGAFSYGGYYTFNVNGSDYTFTVQKKTDGSPYTHSEFAEKMNDAFASYFGVMPDGTQSVEFKLGGGQSFSIVANNKDYVVKTAELSDKNKSLLGFELGDSTRVTNGATTLAQAGIQFGSGGVQANFVYNGTTYQVNVDGTDLDGLTMDGVAALMQTKIRDELTAQGVPNADKFSLTYDKQDAAFRIMGVDIPMELLVKEEADSKNLSNFFGAQSLAVSQPAEAAHTMTSTAGQNAILVINEQQIERSSNTFTIDGLTFTLHNTTHKIDESTGLPIAGQYENATQVNVERDTATIVEGIREFMKGYNEMIDFINNLYKADPTYKDYPPLTAAQEADMTQAQIDKWNEKSKEGLLRSDQLLGSVLQSLRQDLYATPEGGTLALYQLGIVTTTDGKLTEESGKDLKALIEADPEGVRRLFAGGGGLMEKLNTAISNATKVGFGTQGTLVRMAGSAVSDVDSTIYKQITEINNQLSTLENRYWNEYDRYWKQFNTMEKLIQQMNTQSSWLSQQFSS